MEPATIGARLASSVVAPLIRKMFVSDGPGAELVDKPVRISNLVTFKGEKRRLTDTDLIKVAEQLVDRAIQARGHEGEIEPYERTAVVHAVSSSLRSLGTLDMEDVQAVELGHIELSRTLQSCSRSATAGLSRDAVLLYEEVLDTSCLHILNFFTQRSTFVARTLVEQSGRIKDLTRKIDTLITRLPSPADGPFEEHYSEYITDVHGRLEIFGLDLVDSGRTWPLDLAYLCLEALGGSPSSPSLIPAESVLANHERVLLRGVAGSGKTTLIQWLAVSATRGSRSEQLLHLTGLVPFVLPLRTLTRGGAQLPTPTQFLSAVSCPIEGAQPTGWFDRVLRSGRGLLMIDGIDEIPESEREEARTWLHGLISAYPKNRWLVTSRPSAVRHGWLSSDGFVELDMAPMSAEDIAEFVARWHTAAGMGDRYGSEALQTIRSKKDLRSLATNPLMCALICALNQERRGHLPEGRHEIYEAALSMLLSRRDRERGVLKRSSISVSEAHQIQLIQKLAYWLIRNGRSEMRSADAIALLDKVLPAMPKVMDQGSTEQVYRHLLVRSGLLREPSVDTMDFIHRTFQDYLGAKAAVEGIDFDFLVENAHLDQWEDVIRMAVAHARPAERERIFAGLIRKGSPSTKEGRRLYLLAAACLEHATELAPHVREEVQKHVAALLPPRSLEQAHDLAEVGTVALELLPGPDDMSKDEAYYTVVTAARIATEAAIPILARFRSLRDARVRAELARVWNRFDTDRYAEEVVGRLDDTDLYIPVTSHAEMLALQRMGGRAQIQLAGPVEPAEFALTCSNFRVSRLWIKVDLLCSWEWLELLSCLETLVLDFPQAAVDCRSFQGVHSLREVYIPDGAAITGEDILPRSVTLKRGLPVL